MPSIDAQTAQLRWPGYEISGSGRIAIVLECQRRVVLVASPMEANAITAERCGQGCQYLIAPYGNWHKQRTLDVPQQYVYVPGRLGWEDD